MDFIVVSLPFPCFLCSNSFSFLVKCVSICSLRMHFQFIMHFICCTLWVWLVPRIGLYWTILRVEVTDFFVSKHTLNTVCYQSIPDTKKWMCICYVLFCYLETVWFSYVNLRCIWNEWLKESEFEVNGFLSFILNVSAFVVTCGVSSHNRNHQIMWLCELECGTVFSNMVWWNRFLMQTSCLSSQFVGLFWQ